MLYNKYDLLRRLVKKKMNNIEHRCAHHGGRDDQAKRERKLALHGIRLRWLAQLCIALVC